MSDLTFDLDVDDEKINQFVNEPVNDRKVQAAIDRALKKLGAWFKTQAAKGLKDELDVSLKTLRERTFYSVERGDAGKVRIWVGLDDMHALSLGVLRQTKSGVSVRGHRFKGAFVHKNGFAFRRASSKHKNPFDEVKNKKTERNQQRPKSHKLWPRYPLLKVGLKPFIDGSKHLENQERALINRFNTLLDQELNYEFNVRGQ